MRERARRIRINRHLSQFIAYPPPYSMWRYCMYNTAFQECSVTQQNRVGFSKSQMTFSVEKNIPIPPSELSGVMQSFGFAL